MTASYTPPAAIRMRESFERKGKPKGYKKTRTFLDEATGETLYTCDIVGHVARSRVEFCDGAGASAFSLKPNRIVLPTEWRLTGADGRPAGALNQKIFARGFWAGLDAGGRERFRVVDPRSRADRIVTQVLGGAVTRYALMAGDTLVGSVEEEKRAPVEDGGVKGFFKTLLVGSDPLLRLEPAARSNGGIDPRLLCCLMLLLYEITVPLDRST